MIPQTFPSMPDADDAQNLGVVYRLSSVSGLTKWIDYIPVKVSSVKTVVNSYDGDWYVKSLASITGKQAWLDYIPVYVDASATAQWSVDNNGYIPIFEEEAE